MGNRGVGAGDQAKAGRRLRPQPCRTGTALFTAWGAGQQECRPCRCGTIGVASATGAARSCRPRRCGDDDLRLAQLCCGDDPRPRRPFSKWKSAARAGRAVNGTNVRLRRARRDCHQGRGHEQNFPRKFCPPLPDRLRGPLSLLLSFSLSALQTSPFCTASCNALCIEGASSAFSAPAPNRSRSRTGASRCCYYSSSAGTGSRSTRSPRRFTGR